MPDRGSLASCPPRVLGVYCPDWAVTATGVPPDVPVAVVEANRVVAVSAGARAEAVVSGIRRREAQARCPGLTVLRRDVCQEIRSFEPVVVALEELGSRVEVRHPGWCLLATRGPSRYFGGDEALARRAFLSVAGVLGAQRPRGSDAQRPRGSDARQHSSASLLGDRWGVGIADGAFAARLAATRGLVVPPGGSASFLSPFSVDSFDRPELADLLARLGVRTLGQLAALPEKEVVSRFGDEGALVHRLARGVDARRVQGRRPPPDLVVELEADPPIDTVDRAAFAARGMAEDLHGRLAELGLSCLRVVVNASTGNGERLRRLWSHDRPFDPGALAERVRWQLEGWISGGIGSSPSYGRRGDGRVFGGPPSAGLVRISLVADEVVAGDGRQVELWGGEAQVSGRVARATARLQGLLGHSEVVRGRPRGARSPAEQTELVPWGDPAPSRCPAPWPGRLPSPSPALVHLERADVEVLDEAGAPVRVNGRGVPSGSPARLSVAGSPWVTVLAWSGPWPADERWWDEKTHRRQARIQVVVSDGSAHLLSLEGSRWGLEATYG
jgi:protein ImuB